MSEAIKVAEKKDLTSSLPKAVEAKGEKIALFQVGDQYYAVADCCTHAGAPLSDGELNGNEVVCPWHGAKFDVTTGNVLEAPAFEGVKAYKVVVDGDDIKIELE